jgi:hypothetical protein
MIPVMFWVAQVAAICSYFAGPAFLLQLESAEDVRRVELHLSSWRGDPDLVMVVSCPDTLKEPAVVLDKNVRLPASLLEKETAANIRALLSANFFESLPRPAAKINHQLV